MSGDVDSKRRLRWSVFGVFCGCSPNTSSDRCARTDLGVQVPGRTPAVVMDAPKPTDTCTHMHV